MKDLEEGSSSIFKNAKKRFTTKSIVVIAFLIPVILASSVPAIFPRNYNFTPVYAQNNNADPNPNPNANNACQNFPLQRSQGQVPPICGKLIVVKNMASGSDPPSSFTISVTGSNPSLSNFRGSSSGTTVIIGEGSYSVREVAGPGGYTVSYSTGCTGTMTSGQTITCTITNVAPPKLIVVKQVVGGTATAGQFTLAVFAPPSQSFLFSGSESGTPITLVGPGSYQVTEAAHGGYTPTYSPDCSGSISAGQTKTCTVVNTAADLGPCIQAFDILTPEEKIAFEIKLQGSGLATIEQFCTVFIPFTGGNYLIQSAFIDAIDEIIPSQKIMDLISRLKAAGVEFR